MKKLLISLVIVFSLLFVLDVKAIGLNNNNLFDHIHFTNLYGLSDEEMLELGNSVGKDLTEFIRIYHTFNLPSKYIYSYSSNYRLITYQTTDTYNFYINEYDTYYNIYLNASNPTYKVSSKYTSNGNQFYSPSQSNYYFLNISNIQKSTADIEYYAFYISNYDEDVNFYYNNNNCTSSCSKSNISINGTTYSIGDQTTFNLKNGHNSIRNYGPQLKSYSNAFQTEDLDYIRVKLDVADIIDNEGTIQFDYSLENMVLDGHANELPYPYVETLYNHTREDNSSNPLYKTYNFSNYSGNIFETINQDLNTTVYFNFVIDVRGYNDVLILNFSSYYNFEVEVYKKDGTTEVLKNTGSIFAANPYLPTYNMLTVNLNNHKGIILMPKVYSKNDNLGQIYQSITYDKNYTVFLSGVYDIFVRSAPGNYVTLTDSYMDYNKEFFTYNFKYRSTPYEKNINYLKFVKKDLANIENYTITFDTNMFTYSFIDNVDENVFIDDANIPGNSLNTGTVNEDYVLDEANKNYENNDVFDLINQGQISNAIMQIFTDIYNAFRHNQLGIYIFMLIGFSIILFIIRAAKR